MISSSDATPSFQRFILLNEGENGYLISKSQVEDNTLNLLEANTYSSETIFDAKIGELIHEVLEDYAIEKDKTEFLNSLSYKKSFLEKSNQTSLY